MTSLRYVEASSGVKRRSAARISTKSPRARSSASGSGGSAWVVMSRWSWVGRCSRQKSYALLDALVIDEVGNRREPNTTRLKRVQAH